MRSWPHSGFSVDQSVFLPAGDRAGVERLVGYMTRCPFSLSHLVKVTRTGQVIYKAEKDACRAFPDPHRDELARGPKRNFQILGREKVSGTIFWVSFALSITVPDTFNNTLLQMSARLPAASKGSGRGSVSTSRSSRRRAASR